MLHRCFIFAEVVAVGFAADKAVALLTGEASPYWTTLCTELALQATGLCSVRTAQAVDLTVSTCAPSSFGILGH